MTLYEGQGLAALRGERLLFHDLAFRVEGGAALALVGPNGSGKTTLLRLMATLARPFAGQLRWRGRDPWQEPEGFRAELVHVGHLAGLKPGLSAAENLAFEARLHGRPAAAVAEALAAFDLTALAALPLRVLSAGQRRRVALARLVLRPASLWLLDEPTTSLDAASEARLWDLAQRHLTAGGALVAATHADLPLPAVERLDLGAFSPDPLAGLEVP